MQSLAAPKTARLASVAVQRSTVAHAHAVRAPPAIQTAQPAVALPSLLTRAEVRAIERDLLDGGKAVRALRRFNDNLAALPADRWETMLRPVFVELAHDLESFNPAFTAVVLSVQMTLGFSDYKRRDAALQALVQPLAGEYGIAIGQPLLQTHRQLFASWYESTMGEPLETLLAEGAVPAKSLALFSAMMNDIQTGGGATERANDPVAKASYALGYNLAIEYLADYEKTWLLDAFRSLDARVIGPLTGRKPDYLFMEVHAEHECEHAALGHAAVTGFVPSSQVETVREAVAKHDADLATFYGGLADMLELN